MYRNISSNSFWPQMRFTRFVFIAGLVALANCGGSAPPRLFLLSSGAVQVPGERAMVSSGSRDLAVGRTPAAGARAASVAVIVPQYLDRPEIMIRTSDVELEPVPDAKWAEDLAMTASRKLADDLNRLLPGYDIVPWPNRLERRVAYRIEVSLSHFEMESPNQVVIAGTWAITDDAARERASAKFQNAAPLAVSDPKSIAETMSRLLGGVSSPIAAELQKQQQIVGRR